MTTNAPLIKYDAVTEIVSAAAQAEIIALLTAFKAIFASPTSPDYNLIHPELANRLGKHVDAISAAIDAAPTA